MTTPTDRSRRIVMLRAGDHRRAQAGLAKAQADLDRLAHLSGRLDELRRAMAPAAGACPALELRMIGEMADRLDRARDALGGPLRAAAELRDQRHAETRRAEAREDAAARLCDRTQRAAAAALDARREALRPPRRPGPRLRLVEDGAP